MRLTAWADHPNLKIAKIQVRYDAIILPHYRYTNCMIQNMTLRRRTTPRPTKQIQVFRLMPDIIRNLRLAADKRGWSKTTYVQEAIRTALHKDGFDI